MRTERPPPPSQQQQQQQPAISVKPDRYKTPGQKPSPPYEMVSYNYDSTSIASHKSLRSRDNPLAAVTLTNLFI